jgi:hypothetical protein
MPSARASRLIVGPTRVASRPLEQRNLDVDWLADRSSLVTPVGSVLDLDATALARPVALQPAGRHNEHRYGTVTVR